LEYRVAETDPGLRTEHLQRMATLSVFAGRGLFATLHLQAMPLARAAAEAGHLLQLLDIGSILTGAGFATDARFCFEAAQALAPHDVRPLANLANVARDLGDAAACTALYRTALELQPDHVVMRRNLLVSQEYDDAVVPADKRAAAEAWGKWLTGHVAPRQRPPLPAPLFSPAGRPARPLRVGYLSADLNQHTVGLFTKDVFAAHDTARVLAFAYHAGAQRDAITELIARHTTLRLVSGMDDAALEAQIRADGIDVLVDLSGHTAGSRLTVFARRPAPVQVSWLGYFATTGLRDMDAVLLDEAHAPSGTEAQFTETVVRMPQGRWCYVPVPWMPPPAAEIPALRNGHVTHVTFGSFNNSAKLNARVFDLWARLLLAVPDARLMLKWRTFVDPAYCATVRAAFAARGVDPARLDLRPFTFHVDMLHEYHHIDIALDPFPFTGGLTSCEALWMGVPVVTWPQERVVSRQTFALLQAIGLPELAATDAEDYLRIARDLAGDLPRLQALHAGLRQSMAASPLCDVAGFTRGLEDTLWQLASKVAAQAEPRDSARRPPLFRETTRS
jgi:protein O-GlcNAc transferase